MQSLILGWLTFLLRGNTAVSGAPCLVRKLTSYRICSLSLIKGFGEIENNFFLYFCSKVSFSNIDGFYFF